MVGNRLKAVHDFERAIRIEPNNVDAYCCLGNSRLDKKVAIQDYTRAIAVDPKSAARPYAERGYERYFLGDRRGAIEDFSKAIEMNPLYGINFHTRGLIRAEVGDLTGAISDFGMAVELDPRVRCDALCHRGRLLIRIGDYKAAVEDYRTAIQLDLHAALSQSHRFGIAILQRARDTMPDLLHDALERMMSWTDRTS